MPELSPANVPDLVTTAAARRRWAEAVAWRW